MLVRMGKPLLTSLNRAVLSMGKVSSCKKLTEGSLQRKIEKEIVKLDLKKMIWKWWWLLLKSVLLFFFFLFSLCVCVLKKASTLTFSYGAVNPNVTAACWFMGTGNWDRLENNILGKKNQHQSAPFRAVSLFLFLLLLETSDLLEPSRPGAKIKGPSEGNQNMQPKCCTQHKRNCYCAVLSLYQCVSF